MTKANPDQKTVRCKTSCGVTMSFSLYRHPQTGKFRIGSAGKARRGRNPVPVDFIPFEITNAVVNGADYDSMADVEAAVRQL